jgi:hypothetical protein
MWHVSETRADHRGRTSEDCDKAKLSYSIELLLGLLLARWWRRLRWKKILEERIRVLLVQRVDLSLWDDVLLLVLLLLLLLLLHRCLRHRWWQGYHWKARIRIDVDLILRVWCHLLSRFDLKVRM